MIVRCLPKSVHRWVFYLLAFLASALFLPSLLVAQDETVYADAIVVIGGDHKPARIQRAAELYRQGYAPLVIISAGTKVQEGNERMLEAARVQELDPIRAGSTLLKVAFRLGLLYIRRHVSRG